MPTQSIINKNGINSMTPVEPANQSTEPVTAKEFKTKINEYLAEGIKNNLSQDYVARQIETLAKKNPDAASKTCLTDYQIIKKGVKKTFELSRGNRPLALGSASDADLFQWGVNIEADKRILPKPMTEEDKKVIKNVGHDAIIGATLATAVAGATIAVSVAKATWQAVASVAATPQGQQIINNTSECIGGMIDGSPPPDSRHGTACYIIDTYLDYKTYQRSMEADVK